MTETIFNSAVDNPSAPEWHGNLIRLWGKDSECLVVQERQLESVESTFIEKNRENMLKKLSDQIEK